MFDPKKLMEMQQQMMAQMEASQAELRAKEFEGSAGGGVVTCKVSGEMQITDLKVGEEAIDPDDPDLLQDLIVAAVNLALKAAKAAEEESMGNVTGGLNLPPGLLGGM